ncbi:T-cell-specific surface glycoprotein CD28 [Pempheris klunzingeri]|uniref:T-cell-specific surface glycoprotein CD28 n=1 Tax=Pempheris klunzingeri TaxID=3127111 RepID=UPI0039815189
MRSYWMFVILLGYKLSRASPSPSTGPCNDQVKIVCVGAAENVSVHCPVLTGERVTFSLLINGSAQQTCEYEKKSLRCSPQHSVAVAELHENAENKSATFMLSGVNASSYSVYRCDGSIIFPPPFTKAPGDLGILVLTGGHHCKNNEAPAKPGDQHGACPWVWVLLLVSIYSVAVTIMACVSWVKLRGTDSQSDYMNTKPRAPRKNRGVQNPLPRHF